MAAQRPLDTYDEITCPDGTKVNMKALLRDQERAEAALAHLLPSMGGLVSKLRFVYTFEVDTQATDGYNIFVNPKFTNELSFSDKVFVMAHELMHCLLNHMRREKEAGFTDHMRANIAADYEVNITLCDMNITNIAALNKLGAYVDEKWRDISFENIYPHVQNNAQQNQGQQNPQQNQGGSGNNSQQSASSQQSSGNGSQQSASSQQSSGNGSQQSASSQQSSGNGSQQSAGNQQGTGGAGQLSNQPNTPGSYMDRATGDKIAERAGYPKEGPDENGTEKQWEDEAKNVAKKIKQKSRPGQGSAGARGEAALGKKLRKLYYTKKDWKKELLAIVGQSINPADSRTAYVNKNHLIAQNRLARTDKDAYTSPNYIMAWIDVSGSMDQDAINIALENVYQAAASKNPFIRLVVVCFDTDIVALKEYSNVQEYKKKPLIVPPGGGTDARCCFNLLKKGTQESRKYPGYLNNAPDLTLIFTDGQLNQIRRDTRAMQWLIWVILDDPDWDIEYKDRLTRVVRISTQDIKS